MSENAAGLMTIQVWGKVRRFYLSHFKKGYIRKQTTQREGECGRCAKCCSILLECPFIEDDVCSIYERRPLQCRHFPIDGRDLREVKDCGFRFSSADSKSEVLSP